jgi:hypothetical protein
MGNRRSARILAAGLNRRRKTSIGSPDLERFAAFDEGECGVGSPVRCSTDDLSSSAIFPVNEQRGVTVGCGFKRCGEGVGAFGIAVADLGDERVEGVDGLVSSFELGIAALVDTRAVERLEEGAPLGGKADVGTSHRGESLLGALGLATLIGHHFRKDLQGAYRDRGEQCISIGEVSIGGGTRHANATAYFGEGETT